MDIGLNYEGSTRRCYKCEESTVSNLNIAYNASNNTITLWNKFQIYVYEDLELRFVSKGIVPEFNIQNSITASNYLVCVDNAGNLHTTSLKFKNAATQKRFKSSFQTRGCDIIACSLFSEDHIICLKCESNAYFLSIYRMNSEFKLEKIAIVICNELPLQKNKSKNILKSHAISETHKEVIKTKLNQTDLHINNGCSLVLISLDGFNVYVCLFGPHYNDEEITLVKLYTCPSPITNVDIIDIGELNIIIGLQTGTIISFNFRDTAPKIIHLNIAIHKILAFKDNVLYTDGQSMWKAEGILSDNIKMSQLFVKNVNDFIKFGDQIVCVTFNNLIYTFSLEDEGVYLKAQLKDEYCPADNLFVDPDYLTKVKEHVNNNDELLKRQKQERDFIMALSISRRQDVMDGVIKQKVVVYESYEEAIATVPDIILTNNLYEYFDANSFYFHFNITTLREHRMADILSKEIGDLRVHITFNSENKIIITNTINVTDHLNTINFLIPLKTQLINLNDMRVDVRIVTSIPGAYDPKQKIWTVLFKHSVILNSEHFIKFNFNMNKAIRCLKEQPVPLEELILETAKHQYGTILEFSNVKMSPEIRMWQMYVRLPIGFETILRNKTAGQRFASKKVTFFLQNFTAEDFLQSKSSIYLTVCDEKVNIEMSNDGFTDPSLKVSSCDIKITFDIRNFLSNLIYFIIADFTPGKQFVNQSFYVTVENLQKFLKEHMLNGSKEGTLHFIEQFERKVIGALPI